MDLTDLQALSGFLMNESPDISGHFYPPWAGDTDAVVKGEPVPAEPLVHRTQEQAPTRAPLVSSPDTKVGVSSMIKNQTDGFVTNHTAPRPALKTSAGGITRRRSSSKEEQAKKRRERNRVLARRTRLRKKFFFQSLQQQVRVVRVDMENSKLIPPTLALPHMTSVHRGRSVEHEEGRCPCAMMSRRFTSRSSKSRGVWWNGSGCLLLGLAITGLEAKVIFLCVRV